MFVVFTLLSTCGGDGYVLSVNGFPSNRPEYHRINLPVSPNNTNSRMTVLEAEKSVVMMQKVGVCLQERAAVTATWMGG